jgi:RNA polymerase sigma-70 factor (ECF subfamily)
MLGRVGNKFLPLPDASRSEDRIPGGKATLPRRTIEAFRNGSPEAVSEVVRAYAHLVWRVVGRFWENSIEREDAAQEVWLHVFQHRDAIDPERTAELGGWIFVVARRRCIEILRASGKDLVLLDPETDDAPAEAPPDPAEARDLAEAIDTFTAKLEPQWREFFKLYFVEGLDYGEIGKRLQIGRIRCKYMKKVLAARARRNDALLRVLEREKSGGRRGSL